MASTAEIGKHAPRIRKLGDAKVLPRAQQVNGIVERIAGENLRTWNSEPGIQNLGYRTWDVEPGA
jgi:hypothetical protein